MDVLIADSWIVSTTKLDGQDARRAWEFYLRYKESPSHPSLSMERITQARDKKLWSGRISQALRAVIHQDGEERAVLYAGRHDDAYDWARTRRLERNAVTGSLQVVESPEAVAVAVALPPSTPHAPGLFDAHGDAYLLSLGVPPDWVPTLRKVVDDDQLLEVAAKLPEDVQERLLDLAGGKLVTPPTPLPPGRPAIESPDTKRSFFVVDNDDDLRALLAAPLATWLVFLHPSQRRLAEGTFKGPLKVTGSAGTGKTVVAMHRARNLAARGKRVLFTTYATALCANLETALSLLCTPEELARITVGTVHSRALAFVKQVDSHAHPAGDDDIRTLIEHAAKEQGCTLDTDLLLAEWDLVIQAQGLTTWDGYRAASRAGRGTPITIRERKAIWQVAEAARAALARRGALTYVDLCRRARELLLDGTVANPYDAVIVDEVQDLGPQELLLLAALAAGKQDGLTLVGDGGQRIYGRGTSLLSLGIDVRGRSHVLRLNYRTTEQIRRFAERIIRDVADDMEGGRDDRRAVRSLLGGPEPLLRGFATAAEQQAFVCEEIAGHLQEGLQAEEIAIFARTKHLLEPIKACLAAAGLRYRLLGSKAAGGGVGLGTMHGAKGLEFKVVFAIDVSDDQLPQGRAYKGIGDDQQREEALRREMQLLYVGITRARDEIYLTWVGERSRFLR